MFSKIALALAAGKLAAAHTTFQSFVIDGADQGQHKAVQTPSNANNPILDVTSTAMICNGGTEADDYIEVAAGSEIQLQWHHNDGATDLAGDSDEPIAGSHKGPVMVYISPAEAKGEGEVWVKLQEEGLGSDGTTWGVDTFIKNKGLVSVTVPDLAPGNYWIRPEMIGLHEAGSEGKAQFYNGCGQIKVTGSGSTSLPAGVDLTKAYSAQDPGVLCNIYGGDVKCTADGSSGYTIPGPAVWDGASGSGSSPAPSKPSASAPAASAPAASSAPSATQPASSAAPAPSSAAPSSVVAPPAATVTGGYETAPSATQPAAQPTATAEAGSGSGSGSGSTLPETFTISEFIQWLETKTGSATAKRFARAFASRAHARDFA